MAMFLVSMESYDNGLLGNIQFKAPFMNSRFQKFWFKIGKIGKNRNFFVGGQNLKFFEILLFHHICISDISVV